MLNINSSVPFLHPFTSGSGRKGTPQCKVMSSLNTEASERQHEHSGQYSAEQRLLP